MVTAACSKSIIQDEKTTMFKDHRTLQLFIKSLDQTPDKLTKRWVWELMGKVFWRHIHIKMLKEWGRITEIPSKRHQTPFGPYFRDFTHNSIHLPSKIHDGLTQKLEFWDIYKKREATRLCAYLPIRVDQRLIQVKNKCVCALFLR